jgi:DNA replication and repair protein RecF
VYVSQLSLTDFRSYASAELELSAGITALVGPNGHGKTNLVEAVGYVATLGSHRVAQDAPLVRQGAERAVVRAQIHRDGRPTLVEVEIAPGRANRARVNRGPVPRARDVLGLLRSVLFAPEDLALVKGDPGERRKFLDELLTARSPRFAAVRQDYDRVVRQRSTLLKSAGSAVRRGQGDIRTLDIWDQHLATSGAELLAGRLDLLTALSDPVRSAYQKVSLGRQTAGLTYKSTLGDNLPAEVAQAPGGGRELLQARLLEATSRMRATELERGLCLVGPHRDDVVISLGSTPAKGYASHGECWSLALSLRLASYELLRHEAGGDPVLVLDDVFAELDAGRRARLAEMVTGAEQVLITAAVGEDIPESLVGARIDVHGSEVTRVR